MFSQVLSFFFPTLCQICENQDGYSERFGICRPCMRKRNLVQKQANLIRRCKVCGQFEIKTAQDICEYCNSRFVFFSQVVTLRYRLTFEHKILQKCKFQNERILANYLALDFQAKIRRLQIRPDKILLLPSKDKDSGRDYHPAYRLADRLAKKWNINIDFGIRKKSSQKQSSMNYHMRFSHAKKAFEIIKKDRSWEGLHILIIDDIFTTGASLNEVSRLVLAQGAKSVACLVLLSNEGD